MDKYALTQVDLAQIFGVSQPAVFKWLKNSVPSADTVSKIAKHFSLSVDDLLYGTTPLPGEQNRRPSEREVEEMLTRLTPGERTAIMLSTFRKSLIECEVPLADADFKRGWVEAVLQYKTGDVPKGWPAKVKVYKLDAAGASIVLNTALANDDVELILIPAVEKPFVTISPKSDPFRMLTPFCVFALARAAVRLNYGDAVANKILRDLGWGFYLDLLEEGRKKVKK